MGGDTIQPGSIEHVYVQLAGILRERITSGRYAKGTPLPGRTYLANEFGVSVASVNRAVRVLREEGLVVTVTGRGIFVR